MKFAFDHTKSGRGAFMIWWSWIGFLVWWITDSPNPSVPWLIFAMLAALALVIVGVIATDPKPYVREMLGTYALACGLGVNIAMTPGMEDAVARTWLALHVQHTQSKLIAVIMFLFGVFRMFTQFPSL
jgi:hypothetical protein